MPRLYFSHCRCQSSTQDALLGSGIRLFSQRYFIDLDNVFYQCSTCGRKELDPIRMKYQTIDEFPKETKPDDPETKERPLF